MNVLLIRLKHKNFILSFLLFGSLLVSIWLTRTSFFKMDNDSKNQPNTPDAFMTNADYTQFNTQGTLQSHIQAKRITHYSNQDSAVIEAPKILANSDSDNKMQWIIIADHGKSQYGLNVITLTDNVEVRRIELPHMITTLQTSSLTAYPAKKHIETHYPVTITQSGSLIQGVGMTANLKTGDMNLLSEVSGVYEKKELPTLFSSQHVSFNQAVGITIFMGKVKMQQGSTTLLANKLTVLNDKNGKIFKAIAQGNPAHYSTLPKSQKKPLDAFGDKIEYYPQKKIAIILGNGLVAQGGNHFTGPYILYDIEKQTVISKPVSQSSQSVIVLQPQDLQ